MELKLTSDVTTVAGDEEEIFRELIGKALGGVLVDEFEEVRVIGLSMALCFFILLAADVAADDSVISFPVLPLPGAGVLLETEDTVMNCL